MKWFTSDQHFYHENIIDLVCRPYKTVKAMHKDIISKYNSRVDDSDTVYIIGDLFWGKHCELLQPILSKLKGHKHLILGNHDELKPFIYVEYGIESVHTSLEVEEFILYHDVSVSVMDRTKPFICGHVHDLFKKQKNVVNVSVDAWDFYPVSITEIRELFKTDNLMIPMLEKGEIVLSDKDIPFPQKVYQKLVKHSKQQQE